MKKSTKIILWQVLSMIGAVLVAWGLLMVVHVFVMPINPVVLSLISPIAGAIATLSALYTGGEKSLVNRYLRALDEEWR